jgi:hypothetical protein
MIGQEPRLDVTMAVRTKLYTGALPTPAAPPEKVFVGWGNGRACDACDLAITAADLEYETDVLPERRTLHFHQRCFATWEAEL